MNTTTNINTTNTASLTNAGTLAPVLSSANFYPLAGLKTRAVSKGNILAILKSKGENARITESLAIEVPSFTQADVVTCLEKYPSLVNVMIAALHAEQRNILFNLAETGVKTVQYSDITLAKVAEAASSSSVGVGKLSGELIKTWFDNDAASIMTVALTAWLGLSDDVEKLTAEDKVRIEQVNAQLKSSLSSLAAPSYKPSVQVKASLNKCLDFIQNSGLDDSGLATRLKARLNPADAVKKDLAELEALGAL